MTRCVIIYITFTLKLFSPACHFINNAYGKYKLMLSAPMLHNTTAWENVTSSLSLCHVPHSDNIIIKTQTRFFNFLITFYKIKFATKNILLTTRWHWLRNLIETNYIARCASGLSYHHQQWNRVQCILHVFFDLSVQRSYAIIFVGQLQV